VHAEHADVFLNAWALNEICNFSDAELAAIQYEKTRTLVKIASAVPYWSKLLPQSYQYADRDASRVYELPPVQRSDLSKIPLEMRSNMELARKMRSFKLTTSGSTGHPLSFYASKIAEIGSKALYPYVFARAMQKGGFPNSKPPRVLNLGVRTQKYFYPWAAALVDSRSLEDIGYRGTYLYPLLKAIQPEILYAHATHVKRLQFWFERDKRFHAFKAIVYTAEYLSSAERDGLEYFFRCPILSVYGARECSLMGIECITHPLYYHILPWRGRVEIVDDAAKPVLADGTGNITYSFFENPVTPFIRYQLGDRGRLVGKRHCSCALKTDLLAFDGRKADTLRLSDDTVIPVVVIAQHIAKKFSGSIHQFQFVKDQDSFVCKIVPRGPIDRAMKEQIKNELRFVTQDKIEIKIDSVDLIEPRNGKTPIFLEL